MRASTSSISETLVGLEHHRDRLADVAAHALALGALDEDPAAGPLRGPDQVRAREQAQPLAQGRPAHTELGRELLLGAETLAGPQVARREVAPDLERDLLAGIAPRRAPEARRSRGERGVGGDHDLEQQRLARGRRDPEAPRRASAAAPRARARVRAGHPSARARPATSTAKPGQGAVPPACSASRSMIA